MNQTPTQNTASPDLSLTERLQNSITFILDAGEEVFSDQSEDTTNDDRITAMRLLSAAVLPVYRAVRKPRLPDSDPVKEQGFQKFKERVEKSVVFFLINSEKLISGAYGAISLDERLIALRLMASVTVPVYRLTHRTQDPANAPPGIFPAHHPIAPSPNAPYSHPSYQDPDQETEDAYEDIMGQLCLLEDILQLPPTNPVLQNVLARAAVAKQKKFGANWTPEPSAAQKPAVKSAPKQKNNPVKPATPEFRRPTNPPHRYKPVKTEPTQEELDLIQFSIHKHPEPELITPSELENRFPLPDLSPKFDKIVRHPRLKPKFRKASQPPSPPKPDYYPDS